MDWERRNKEKRENTMALDYTKGCVNFRDAGEWVNCIAGMRLLPEGRLLRGGKIDFVMDAAQIGNPGTIICLRKGADPANLRFNADFRHFPISNNFEKYETSTPEVRRWLQDIFCALATDVTRYPILFHCTSGKDRTGVVVACLLQVLGIDRRIIIDEYLLSEGDVKREWIEMALDSCMASHDYFRKIDLTALKMRVFGS